jgi:cell wall assembly regulator SMI1
MNVTWRPRLWGETAKAADEAQIASVEAKLGVKFPPDYRDFVRTHQGMSPDPNVFSFVEKGRTTETNFGVLYHFEPDSTDRIDAMYFILRAIDDMSEWLPPGVVPFTTDDGGNPIAFDYRASKDRPPIVFMDHGEASAATETGGTYAGCHVADTFTDLIGVLHPLGGQP